MQLNKNKTENKTELLLEVSELLSYNNHTWPEFLVTDCQEFVENLHSYRLQHLLENIQDFSEYMDVLEDEYTTLLEDEILAPQAQATIQALFLLSCVEFTSASKERMLIREMEVRK